MSSSSGASPENVRKDSDAHPQRLARRLDDGAGSYLFRSIALSDRTHTRERTEDVDTPSVVVERSCISVYRRVSP